MHFDVIFRMNTIKFTLFPVSFLQKLILSCICLCTYSRVMIIRILICLFFLLVRTLILNIALEYILRFRFII